MATIREQVRNLLANDDDLTAVMIAKRINRPVQSVSSKLTQMVKRGELIRLCGAGVRGGSGYSFPAANV